MLKEYDIRGGERGKYAARYEAGVTIRLIADTTFDEECMRFWLEDPVETAPKHFTGTDETLTCTRCNDPFAFTVHDQDFYASKGWTNKPRACKRCRILRRR